MNDWIKMRGSLFEHPKVLALARAVSSTPSFAAFLVGETIGKDGGMAVPTVTPRHDASRYVTVAALLRVWSTCRAFGKFEGDDLLLPISSVADVDQMAGITGFGEAMRTVGWLENGNGLRFPKFKEFNVPMTDAERAAAYRDRKRGKPVDKAPDTPSRAVTANHGASRRRGRGREEPSLAPKRPVPAGGSTGGGDSTASKPTPVPTRARPETPALDAACKATWEAYATAYRQRWGHEPVRNAQANSLVRQFCQTVPMEEAPEIARWYCTHPRAFYVQNHHALTLLQRDANGLRTEWLNGRPQTAIEARHGEQSAARGAVFHDLIREAEETPDAKG